MFGAGVSVAAIVIMLLLFIAELMDYLSIKIEDHLVIDNTEYEMLPINFNITLHRIPCSSLTPISLYIPLYVVIPSPITMCHYHSVVSLDVIDAGGTWPL